MGSNGAAKVKRGSSDAIAEPKRIGLADLIRGVLGWKQGAVSPLAAVTRQELGLRPRRVREANRVRQARRQERRLMRARRPEAYR